MMIVSLWLKKLPRSLFTLKPTTKQTEVLHYESYYYLQICSINLLIMPHKKENLMLQNEDQRFQSLNVNKTMKMSLLSTSENIILSHQVTHKIQPLLRLVELVYYYYHHHNHHLVSHFSALAGKYSPVLGCSNQQDQAR